MTYLSIHLSVVASNVDSTTILQKLYILAINVRSLLKAEIDQFQLFRSCTATAGGPMILMGSIIYMCGTYRRTTTTTYLLQVDACHAFNNLHFLLNEKKTYVDLVAEKKLLN